MNHFKFQIHVIHIQYLFPFPFFLDNHSIKQAHNPALDVVLDKAVWSLLTKRVCNWKMMCPRSVAFQQMKIQVNSIEDLLFHFLFCKHRERVVFEKIQNHVR